MAREGDNTFRSFLSGAQPSRLELARVFYLADLDTAGRVAED
jgi:hypothetical protein